jgi:hypothetical protein
MSHYTAGRARRDAQRLRGMSNHGAGRAIDFGRTYEPASNMLASMKRKPPRRRPKDGDGLKAQSVLAAVTLVLFLVWLIFFGLGIGTLSLLVAYLLASQFAIRAAVKRALVGTVSVKGHDENDALCACGACRSVGAWLKRDLPTYYAYGLTPGWLAAVAEGCSGNQRSIIERYVTTPMPTASFLEAMTSPPKPDTAPREYPEFCVHCAAKRDEVVCAKCGRCSYTHPYGTSPDGLIAECRVEAEAAFRRSGHVMPSASQRMQNARKEAMRRWPERFGLPRLAEPKRKSIGDLTDEINRLKQLSIDGLNAAAREADERHDVIVYHDGQPLRKDWHR